MTDKKTTKKQTKNNEKFTFDVEVNKVLKLMINSLYTNKDVAIRELVSNASDACDKLRYVATTNDKILGKDTELKVKISIDEKAKTITIADNGIGMNRDDLISQLGTIARSGTESFIKSLSENPDKGMQLIGQFGVGFYSSFMIADKVTVTSKKAGESKSYIWESEGDGSFEIKEGNEKDSRGTSIVLHLKEGENDFLDKYRIKNIIKTYSDHIAIPVEFIDEKGKAEVLNSASALWTRPKKDITEEQYNEFYKHISHLPNGPFMTLHNKSEGVVEFTNLLFIPNQRPFDLYHPERSTRVKLYVKKVFITEDAVDLLPRYLRFAQGIIDSQDLPLNISRETLQHNRVIEKIKQTVTNKILDELKKKVTSEPEEYKKFWDNFGPVLKEGLCESIAPKDKILKICKFRTSKSVDEYISLDEYVDRMQVGQDKIYYLTAESIEKAQQSAQLEGFASRGVEVLFLVDSVDDFWVTVTSQYAEKELHSINRTDIDLESIGGNSVKDKSEKSDDKKDGEKSKDKKDTKETELKEFFKNILGQDVKSVEISKKLTESPVCLAVDAGGMDMRLEKFLIDQKQLVTSTAKILEINPKHSIVEYVRKNMNKKDKADELKDIVWTLFDEACIIEGQPIKNPKDFARRLNGMIGKR